MSYYTTEKGLLDAFSNYGQVVEGIFCFKIKNTLTLNYSLNIISSLYGFLAFNFFTFPAKIITDRVSDKSKGFGFVTFASQDEAENAITGMNGMVIHQTCHSLVSFFFNAFIVLQEN